MKTTKFWVLGYPKVFKKLMAQGECDMDFRPLLTVNNPTLLTGRHCEEPRLHKNTYSSGDSSTHFYKCHKCNNPSYSLNRVFYLVCYV